MASVPVTLDGVVYDLLNRTTQRVVFIGQASLTGLGVGGGPVIPDAPPPGGPPGQPIHPIWGPPGFSPPGAGMPPGIWGGPVLPPEGGGGGSPVFPIWGPPGISLPPGSGYPPVAGHPLPPPGGSKPPEPVVGWEAKVIWTADTGWAVVIVPKPGTEVPTPSKK